MNIEDIQSAWNEQHDDNIHVPKKISVLKTASQPVQKIRRHLRTELYIQLLAFGLLGFLPILFHYKRTYSAPFYILFIVATTISIYYGIRMYFFYKRTVDNTLSSKEHLYEIYYDARLHMEMFKSVTYIVFAFGLLFCCIHLATVGQFDFTSLLNNRKFVWLIIVLISVPVFTELYVRWRFGKYIRQIKQLLEELNEE